MSFRPTNLFRTGPSNRQDRRRLHNPARQCLPVTCFVALRLLLWAAGPYSAHEIWVVIAKPAVTAELHRSVSSSPPAMTASSARQLVQSQQRQPFRLLRLQSSNSTQSPPAPMTGAPAGPGAEHSERKTAKAAFQLRDPGGPTMVDHPRVSSSSRRIERIGRAKVASENAALHQVSAASRKPVSCRIRVGCRILRKALASIWRIRSRVT
jgi:hypothetical protein